MPGTGLALADAGRLSRRPGLWGLFALAPALRLAFLTEAARTDLFWPPVIDAPSYDLWAQAILQGGGLGREVPGLCPLSGSARGLRAPER
jgi:hypothetical protein